MEDFFTEILTDAFVGLIVTAPLMIGLNCFGISAPFWGCFALSTALRWTMNSSAGSGRH